MTALLVNSSIVITASWRFTCVWGYVHVIRAREWFHRNEECNLEVVNHVLEEIPHVLAPVFGGGHG